MISVLVSECSATACLQRDVLERARLLVSEQALCILQRADRRFCHAIVENRRKRLQRRRIERLSRDHLVRNAAFDALDARKAAHVRDIGRLARPGRDRAGPRNDDECGGMRLRVRRLLV